MSFFHCRRSPFPHLPKPPFSVGGLNLKKARELLLARSASQVFVPGCLFSTVMLFSVATELSWLHFSTFNVLRVL